MTDDEKRPVWQWPYSAFGNNKPTGLLVQSSSAANMPPQLKATEPIEFGLRFPGQHEDAEAGLSNNLFRWYQSGHGRYTQPDPIGLPGGLNRFLYGNGDALRYLDPDGRNPLLLIAGLGSTAYGTYSLLGNVLSCRKMCELTHGDEVKACGGERQDIVDSDRFRRVERCKAGCALSAAFESLLPYDIPR